MELSVNLTFIGHFSALRLWTDAQFNM